MKISVTDVNINHTYYIFDDINIKDFDPNNIKIDEKSCKSILIWYIGYVTIKEDLKMCSVNPFYLVFGNVNEDFEKIHGNKHLMLVPTSANKEKIKKYEEL